MNNKTYILASQSPRRKELLKLMGIDYEVIPAMGEEISDATEPSVYVQELASEKAKEVYERYVVEHPGADPVVIGADTIVAYGGTILGKPKDKDEAREMIHNLSGKSHYAMTGVALWWKGIDGSIKSSSFCESTEVVVAEMTEEEIESYISTPAPYDKAGAYGIQGEFGIYISGIKGDYNAVVGLPVAHLYQEMKKQGLL